MDIKEGHTLKNLIKAKILIPLGAGVVFFILMILFVYNNNKKEALSSTTQSTQQVDILKTNSSELNNIKKQMSGLSSSKGYLKEDIDDKNISKISTKIDELQQEMNNFNGKSSLKKEIKQLENEAQSLKKKINIISSKYQIQSLVNKFFIDNQLAIKGTRVNPNLILKKDISVSTLKEIDRQVDTLDISDEWLTSVKKIISDALSQAQLISTVKDRMDSFYNSSGDIIKGSDFSSINEIKNQISKIRNQEVKQVLSQKINEIQEAANKKVQEEAEKKAQEEAVKRVQEEAVKKVQEEAEKKAQEEAVKRVQEEVERKAQEEAVKRAQEEAEKQAQENEPNQDTGGDVEDQSDEGDAENIDELMMQ